jgi:excisionase family DNA binding protein
MNPESEIKAVAYRIPRAAQVTGLSRSMLYQLMKEGELAYVKVRGRRLIADNDLRALIERHRVAGEVVK